MGGDPPRRNGRAWLACLLAAGVAAVVVPLLGSARDTALGVVQTVAAAVTAWAVWRYRPYLTQAWGLLAAAAACAGIGQTYGAVVYRRDGAITYPSIVDWLLLLHLLLITVGLVLMLRRRTAAAWTGALLDAAIGLVGAAAVMWAFIASPALRGESQPAVAVAVSVAYALAHLVVSGLVVWFRFGTEVRTVFARLLAMAVGARVVGDMVAFAQITATGRREVDAVPVVLWALWALLLPAAVMHPSARTSQGYGLQPGRELTGWLRTIGVLTVGCPVVIMAGYLLTSSANRIRPPDLIVLTGLLTLLSLLLVVQASRSARLAERRAAELDRQSTNLARSLRQQEELRAELTRLAMHDPLTGLANRNLLTARTRGALARPGPHALMLIDLDGFKEVNDELGHPVGDELLTVLADRLRTAVPPGAVVARLGGDEFAVLVQDVCPAQARTVADAVCRSLAAPCLLSGREVALTSSIGLLVTEPADGAAAGATAGPADGPAAGVATGSADGATAVFRDADLALYAAKAAGKNRVVVFSPELGARRAAHGRLLAGLRRAADEGGFTAAYEPMVELAGERVVAVEALIRWRAPDGEELDADRILPVAEENGLGLPVGDWLLREGFDRAGAWYARHGVAVAVDVSSRQLRVPDFADRVLAGLAAHHLPGAALILEITESALLAITGDGAAGAQLDRLRANGVRVALDAFGTGSSSPAHLRRFPVDIIKLHPTLLDSTGRTGGPVGADPTGGAGGPDRAGRPGGTAVTGPTGPTGPVGGDWSFVRAVLDLGRSLRMQTVATGVPSPADLAALRALGCHVGQGGAVGPRLSLDEVERVLHSARR